MREDIYKCNHCKQATEDVYAEKGWLVIRGSISWTRGRDKNRAAKTSFMDCTNSEFHFCSMSCFDNYLRRIK